MNKKGIGLAELLAVVIVMGIVAGISVPLVGNVIKKVEEKKIYSDALLVADATRIYCTNINYKTDFCKGKGVTVDEELNNYISGGYKAIKTTLARLANFDNNDKLYYVKSDGVNHYYVEIENGKYTYKGDPSIHKVKDGCYVSKDSNFKVEAMRDPSETYESLVAKVNSYCLPGELEKPEDNIKPSDKVKETIDKIESGNDILDDRPRFEVGLDQNGNIHDVTIKPKLDGDKVKDSLITVEHIRGNEGLKEVPNISFGSSIENDDGELEEESCEMHYNGEGMFKDFTKLETIDFGETEMDEPDKKDTLMSVKDMFKGCISLHTVKNLPEIEDNATDASGMFSGCVSLTNVNLASADSKDKTSITIADEMFRDCKSLSKVDLRNLPYVKSANSMFSGCTSLKTLDLSKMKHLESTKDMLKDTYMLVEIKITNLSLADSGIYIGSGWYLDGKKKDIIKDPKLLTAGVNETKTFHKVIEIK